MMWPTSGTIHQRNTCLDFSPEFVGRVLFVFYPYAPIIVTSADVAEPDQTLHIIVFDQFLYYLLTICSIEI